MPHVASTRLTPDEQLRSRQPDTVINQGTLYMTPECPKCQSVHVETRNHGRKAGGAIGTVAGVASGASAALSGAEVGAVAGAIAGPVGSVFGLVAGAIIGGLIGGSAGCAAGAVLGEVVDQTVLDNYVCRSCGHTFSKKPPEAVTATLS
ncbi:hypothetical protein [Paraburkholderia aromaticivorans]|uniref:hypothetical protein n=2 Tax=Paraburkholderia TaxID=1822464 RepID=UPI0026CB3B5B